MTPAARIAASMELLESIMRGWQGTQRIAADRACDQYFKARRFIGSKDRGAVAELVYWMLRHKAALEWWCARLRAEPSARMLALVSLLLRGDMEATHLATLCDGSKYAPRMLTDGEWQVMHALAGQSIRHADMPDPVRLNYPAWMEPHLRASFPTTLEAEMRALQQQAPVDLRANTLRGSREQVLEALKEAGYHAVATPLSPLGMRLHKREAIFASSLFRHGFFEMQDEGSQAVALLVEAAPGMKVIDFCAGAGGKTLALAADMQNKGRLLAWDTSAKRLGQMPERLRRAGVHNTECRTITSEADSYLKRHKLSADRVLVDAPCSGSGTWRRNPDLKWRFTEKDLKEVMDMQRRILSSAARMVKVGGRLIYATCSMLACENDEQVKHFLHEHPNFRVVCAKKIWNKTQQHSAPVEETASYLCLTPHQDGTDGFFAAVLERISA